MSTLQGGDAARMMQYDANKKSVGVAYLLWFFLGMFGAHRFYLGEKNTGIAILAITLGSGVLMLVAIGLFTIWAATLWVLIDAFLIPGMARKYNETLAASLTPATEPALSMSA